MGKSKIKDPFLQYCYHTFCKEGYHVWYYIWLGIIQCAVCKKRRFI